MTTYDSLSQRTQTYADANMLAHAQPILVLQKFGLSKPVPKNKADNVTFRRPIPFDALAAPLAEGVTPQGQQMRYEDVPCQLQQWGAVTWISDKVADTAEDPVLSDATMLIGEQMAETHEHVLWGVLRGGTNVFRANGAARGDINTPVSLNKMHAIVRALHAQRARYINNMLTGSAMFGTKPIEGGFVAFGHTDLEHDIRKLPGFTPTAEYGSRSVLCAEELGSTEKVRWILSPLLDPFLGEGSGTLNGMKSVGGSNVDVYPIVFVAKESYGTVPLKGRGEPIIKVKQPDDVDKSDPLGQRGFVSAKSWFAAARLNELWMARLEVGVTNL